MMKIVCDNNEIRSLKPGNVKAILDENRKGEFLLLDIRQLEEYKQGHIPGALLIPLGELEARHGELDRDEKIIVYCRSGHRSKAAAIALCRLGFRCVYHMDGGIINWPYETIRGMPEAKPESIIESANVQDILILAIRLEKRSWDFYMAARNKVQLPKAMYIFQMLADIEESHMQRLYEHAIDLLDEKMLPFLEKLKTELKAEPMEDITELTPTITNVNEKLEGEMEALEIALGKEYLSYDFYKRTSTLVKCQDAKTLLHELCLDERNHANIVLKQLERVIGC
jgi:sulfur-carrier protein adenylyltransferase/sulfurtransferase